MLNGRFTTIIVAPLAYRALYAGGQSEAATDFMHAEIDYVPRGRHRLKLFQPAEMRVARTLLRVHVLNISLTGALVHRDSPPSAGTIVELVVRGMERRASVAWASGARLGVHFQQPLSEAELARVIACEAADVAERRRLHIL